MCPLLNINRATRSLHWRLSVAMLGLFPPGTVSRAEPVTTSPYADQPAMEGNGRTYFWRDAPVHDFGPTPVVFDATGMRRLSPAPAPGVHPRIYFTQGDLAELRRRYHETESGKLIWNIILCWTETMKGRYDPQAPYTKPDFWKGFNGWVHGPAPLMSFQSAAHKEYAQLVRGNMNAPATGVLWGAFSLEALRCLVADDAKGAQDLAAAGVTAMRIDQQKRATQMARDKKSGPPDVPVGSTDLANVYDLKAGIWQREIHRLVFPSDSVSPDYKVLVFPHREGSPLPVTRWNKDHRMLLVEWPDQKDVIVFTPRPGGKPDLAIRRGIQTLIELNRPVPPLPYPPQEAREKARADIELRVRRDMTAFDPAKDRGILQVWDFATVKDGAVTDRTGGRSRLALAGLTTSPGRFGPALEFAGAKEGLKLPVDLRPCKQTGFSVVFWMKAPGMKDGGGFSCNGSRA